MPSAVRQTKRPFQPSITSYFARADRDESYLHQSSPFLSSDSSRPSLPAPIQSSLLNVGMRVRKSVPEGYKTGAYCALGSSTGTSSPSSTGASSNGGVYNSRGRGFAELTPYCGTLRTGGYASRTTSERNRDTRNLATFEFDSDDYGFPCSSQGSNDSTISTDSMPVAPPYSSANKRRFEEEDEDIYHNNSIGEEDEHILSLSPRSYPVSHTSMPNLDMIRPIALPKSRRKWLGKGSPTRGQEIRMNGVQDFDEADFLRPPEWVDGEIEMGGI